MKNSNILSEYLRKTVSYENYVSNKQKEDELEEMFEAEEGPVLTISRETGCPVKHLVEILITELNKIMEKNDKPAVWRPVSKEILNESAKELNRDPSQIDYIFRYEKKSLWNDAFSSLTSPYYISDMSIRKKIGKVIRSIGSQGFAIIIGRGGVALTKDIAKSLHIHLQAPLEWRAVQISMQHNFTIEKAKKYAREYDAKRKELRDSFSGKKTDYSWFDVHYNSMTLYDYEIAASIIHIMEYKHMI